MEVNLIWNVNVLKRSANSLPAKFNLRRHVCFAQFLMKQILKWTRNPDASPVERSSSAFHLLIGKIRIELVNMHRHQSGRV
jgi:hypothetical protein